MSSLSHRAVALGEIARAAGVIAQESRRNLVRELKPDGSIVTNGDRDVETWLRKELPVFQPQTGFWGEEFGHEDAGEHGLWLVDPVDGTSNFSFGSPLWGVSIALLLRGEMEVGAIFLPDLDELYVAERGNGATMNGKPIPMIPPGPVQAHELVSYGDNLARLFPQVKVPGKMRLTGAFVIDGTFTAVQRFRGLVGHRERLYDVAACVVIGREAGAEIRYVDGSKFDLDALSKPIQIQKPWMIFPRESGFAVV
jgi:myo-inositol-1(or 4)-monophosphatase